MNYKVNLEALDSSFRVPNALADNFIKLANPKHMMVLLWVLRHADTPKSTEDIAAELHLDKAIVGEAIFYWIENGFMVPDGAGTIPAPAPAAVTKKETISPAPAKDETPPAAGPEKALGSSMASDEEILQRAKESPEFKYLLQKSQQIFGRTISKAERSMLLSLMDYYGLPVEVILMLISYAAGSGRTGTNYIQTVGIAWAEEEIKTLEQAESKIKALNKSNKLWNNFTAQAGIAHKNPTKKQEALFVKWTREWKFSIEIIVYAYEKMLDSIDKVNYNYLDKILAAWHEAGLKTIAQIEAADAERAPQKKQKTKDPEDQPSFSIEKYEQYLQNRKLVYKKEE